jgi:hypothetical protein
MAADIRAFTEELLEITPTNLEVNPYGGMFRMPTVGSRGVPGTGHASTDVTQNLRRAAVEFAEAYSQPDATLEKAKKLAQEIEGILMMEETLSILSASKADRLIGQLEGLMKEKYGTQHN